MKKPRKRIPLSPGTCVPWGEGGLELTLVGKPEPQSRPKVLKTGRVISSARPELRAWRKSIEVAIRAMVPPIVIVDRTLIGAIVFGMPTYDQARWGELSSVLPDVDNLGKAILDSMQDDRAIRAKLRKTEEIGGYQWKQEMPLEDDGRIGALLIVKVHVPPPGFMRVRLEPVSWDRHSLAWSLRRLAEIVGDPSLISMPAVDPAARLD